MKKDLSVIFMGTPGFATEILRRIHKDGINIKAVITAPDRKSGRGQKVNMSDVKKYALEQDFTILQPNNLKDESFINQLKELNADLFVVVAFRMLPEVVWNMPTKGTINLHASLLPNYRGAAPINWAIINGEKETGVTTFFIEKEIDTGLVIEREKLSITPNEDAGELHDRLMFLGADLISSSINKIATDSIAPIDQAELSEGELPIAPKIFKPDCLINFNNEAQIVHNFIRGLSPYPAAWCKLFNSEKDELKTYKLFSSQISTESSRGKIKIITTKEGILFPTNDFYILIKEIQMEGKRKMKFSDFLAGNSTEHLTISKQ